MTIFVIFSTGIGVGYLFLPTLADRVQALERGLEACCSTSSPPTSQEEREYADYVALKKRIQKLERELEEIRAMIGVRR
jgi:hypothetical protein